ncbi:dUTP diphosphatase [Candidatus Aerophobetes bacterium]|uniref:Deoxyuridine 5'-triphosphate nucleotidohydrolase n=1 Tax=Aerophobetes bacterium TaxID=2030807 RepID=A0A2A4WXT3_UNCAE|nr:MAG: dUTP diphosphatase [Candidatus Aerophobetes bacterium]
MKFVGLEEGVEKPVYASKGAAGADIRAFIREDITLMPGDIKIIPTGLKCEIPQGFEIQVRPRSGLAAKEGVTVLNSPGTIDSDYRGEIAVILINHGKAPFIVKNQMRIAQIVVAQVTSAIFEDANELSLTARGEGGFGHTGRE